MMAFVGVSLLILSIGAVFAVRYVVTTQKNGGTTHVHVHPATHNLPVITRNAAPRQRGATHQTTCFVNPANSMRPSPLVDRNARPSTHQAEGERTSAFPAFNNIITPSESPPSAVGGISPLPAGMDKVAIQDF